MCLFGVKSRAGTIFFRKTGLIIPKNYLDSCFLHCISRQEIFFLLIMRILLPSLFFILACLMAVPLVAQNQADAPERYKVIETYDELVAYIGKYSDQTVVINYWASFCGPCIREVPYFDSLQEKYRARNLKVVMVSLDFKSQLKVRLDKFLDKHSLNLDIVVLADQDADAWIPRVCSNPEWDGEMPFTLVYQKNIVKDTHRQDFQNFEDLEAFVLPYLQPKPTLYGK